MSRISEARAATFVDSIMVANDPPRQIHHAHEVFKSVAVRDYLVSLA